MSADTTKTARPAGFWLAIAAGVVVVATVATAIGMMGSPWQQRLMRLDAQRVNDLQQLESRIELHANKHDALPPDLRKLVATGANLALVSPETHAPYEYIATGKDTYQLCAIFDTDNRAVRRSDLGWSGDLIDWAHAAGRHCFARDVDLD